MRPDLSRCARVALLTLLSSVGCVGGGHSYVWVDDLPSGPKAERVSTEGYVIRPGDLLSVKVWGQDGMSARTRVRQDGRISLLFLNDVQAAGLTPLMLAEQLQTRLKDYLAHPVVSVDLEEIKPLEVPVLGEVSHPGMYPLAPGSGVLQALAAAGGLTDYASSDRVFILRQGPGRIRFHYRDLTRATGRGASFTLQPGDVLVVE